jgi:hypothetical protein
MILGILMMSRSSGPCILAMTDQRPKWVADEKRTALLLLIGGRFRAGLPDRTVLLARQGDYVVFHGISHSLYG